MTKKDLRVVIVGSTVGIGIFAALFYWARKTQTIPVLAPTMVKWDAGP